jgi:hypothetical protein
VKREQLKYVELPQKAGSFPPLRVEMRGGVGHSSNRKYSFDRSYRLYEAEGGTQWGSPGLDSAVADVSRKFTKLSSWQR